MQYRCFRDICHAASQYCHEGEKRCVICTMAQCEKYEAEKIFNQCDTKCKEWMSITTVTPNSTDHTPVQVCSSQSPWTQHDVITLMLLLLVVFSVLVVIFLLIKLLRQRQMNTRYSAETLYDGEGAEVQPLFRIPMPNTIIGQYPAIDPVKRPIQINTVSDSGSVRTNNMVYDAEILNDATVGRHGQQAAVAQPQQ